MIRWNDAWTWLVPLLAAALLTGATTMAPATWLTAACAIALIGAVIAAVHHAEVVAHRVGEPFGTLVLALAITVIEVALIISMMLAGGAETAALPRDTVFSAVMIIGTGVVGLCLLIGQTSRTISPEGDSTLITSAPISPNSWAAYGPINIAVISTTRIPFSGPLII